MWCATSLWLARTSGGCGDVKLAWPWSDAIQHCSLLCGTSYRLLLLCQRPVPDCGLHAWGHTSQEMAHPHDR